jgi:hypothetical protein
MRLGRFRETANAPVLPKKCLATSRAAYAHEKKGTGRLCAAWRQRAIPFRLRMMHIMQHKHLYEIPLHMVLPIWRLGVALPTTIGRADYRSIPEAKQGQDRGA